VHVTPQTNITRYNYIQNKLRKFIFYCLKNKKVEAAPPILFQLWYLVVTRYQ